MARDAVVGEHRLAGCRVACGGCRRLPALACVLGAGARAGLGCRADRAVEPEEPEAVAVRRRREGVASGEKGDVLLAVLLEDGRGVVRSGAGLEAPEPATGGRVVRLQLARVASDEDDVPCRRRGAGIARLGETLLPDHLAACRIDGSGGSGPFRPRDARRAGGPGVALTRPGIRRVRSFEADPRDRRADVDHLCVLVVAHRLPVDAALWAVAVDQQLAGGRRCKRVLRDHLRHLLQGADRLLEDALHVLLRRRAVRGERTVRGDRLCRPALLRGVLWHGRLLDAVERLAGRPVEHVEPAGLARLRDPLLSVGVEQDDGTRRVVVPDVVVHLLEVPLELARLQVERADRRRIEVLAGALAAEPVRAGVAGRDVEEPELRVDRRRLPDRPAAAEVLLRARGPRIAARLARSRGCVPTPHGLPGRGVERLQERPRSILGADDADVDLPVDIGRRSGDRLPELPFDEPSLPERPAGLLVERNHPAVELSQVHAAVADRDAPVVPATADGADLLRDARRVLPQDLAGGDADGVRIILAARDVDDALVDDRLALGRILRGEARAEVRTPDALELRDVRRVDLVERRVALVHQAAADGRPVGIGESREI